MSHVFLDCDGVLADFDSYAEEYFGMPPRQYEAEKGAQRFWKELEEKGDFYRNMPLMDDARVLVDGVRHLNPTILTGCPRGTWAQGQKVEWAAEHFPGPSSSAGHRPASTISSVGSDRAVRHASASIAQPSHISFMSRSENPGLFARAIALASFSTMFMSVVLGLGGCQFIHGAANPLRQRLECP